MYRLACRLLHDPEAARDIVQDVFRSVLDGPQERVTTPYLLQAVRYACFKHVRDLSTRQRLIRFYALDMDETDSETWPDDEELERLRSLINNQLPERTRTILELKFIKGLKYREIAQELSISEVAVYKQLRNAINTLRLYFKNDERQN